MQTLRNEQAPRPSSFGLTVVGFGPGGIGPLVNAAANSEACLDAILARGVCVLDAHSEADHAGRLAEYLIKANVTAGAFIAGFTHRSHSTTNSIAITLHLWAESAVEPEPVG